MSKKKWIGMIAALAAIAALAGIIIATVRHIQSRDAITRYEWIKLLCERENIEGYENAPFYSDVDETDEYYDYVQAAAERDVIPINGDFNGDDKSTGRFVALTAIRSVGKGRIKLALENEGDISDEDYLDIAIEYDLISEKKLNGYMSAEDCRQLLDKLDELYYTAFLKDDYESIKYRDNVIILPDEVVIDYAMDYSAIVVDSRYESLTVNDIIVFYEKNTHSAVARRMTGKTEEGAYILDIPEINEVVEELKISDIVEVTAEDILNYYGSAETVGIVKTSFFDKPPYESKGFSIKVDTNSDSGKNLLEISVINNDTGAKCEIPNDVILDDDEKYTGEFSINRITLASMINYKHGKLDYADIAMDMDMYGKAGIKSEIEKRIPLVEVPVPLGSTGAVMIMVKLNLLIDVEGSITVSADIPVTFDIGYDSAVGGIKKQSSIEIENGELLIDAKGELSAEAEGILRILYTENIVDAEIRVGAIAEAKTENRDNGMICDDVEAKAPVVRFALCDDDTADSLLGKFYDVDRVNDNPNNTIDVKAKQFHFHYEIYPDGNQAFVDECTYKPYESRTGEDQTEEALKESLDEGASNEDETDLSVKAGWTTYTTKYGLINAITCPTFKFDYPDNWMITEEYFDPSDGIIEEVILEDTRGAKIIYMHYTKLGYGGRVMISGETQKVSDSMFVPSYPAGTDTDMSSLGSFAVAQVHIKKSLDMGLDDDYREVDDVTEYATYGIIPEKDLGYFEDIEGTDGIYELLSFEYPRAHYCFVANPPLDGWTKQELEEMISILSSFRVSDE